MLKSGPTILIVIGVASIVIYEVSRYADAVGRLHQLSILLPVGWGLLFIGILLGTISLIINLFKK